MLSTSASLLERLRASDPRPAWDRLVQLYAPLIHGWAIRAGLQDADAADLVQEVFAILLKKLPEFRYDPSKSFQAWLKTVALNHWRTRRRREAFVVTDATIDPVQADPAEEIWEAEYHGRLAGRALQIMRTEFEDKTWRACWLTAVDGESPSAAAKQLGMSVAAVYGARCRVLARLRQELTGLLE